MQLGKRGCEDITGLKGVSANTSVGDENVKVCFSTPQKGGDGGYAGLGGELAGEANEGEESVSRSEDRESSIHLVYNLSVCSKQEL